MSAPHAPVRTTRTRVLMKLIRIENCAAIAATTLLGAYLAAGARALPLGRVLDAAAVAFLLHAAGNVLNDRVDASLDALARPSRPVPSGRISLRTADALFWVLTAAGLAAAALLGAGLLTFAVVVTGLSVAYSCRLKNSVLLGNLLIATLAASTLVYGALAAGGGSWAWIPVAVADVVLLMLAYEVIKCVQDHDSDGALGLRTISTVFGTRTALRVAVGTLGVVAALVLATALVPGAPAAYRAAAVLSVGLVGASALTLLRNSPTESVLSRSLVFLKVGWLVGVVTLALLRT